MQQSTELHVLWGKATVGEPNTHLMLGSKCLLCGLEPLLSTLPLAAGQSGTDRKAGTQQWGVKRAEVTRQSRSALSDPLC